MKVQLRYESIQKVKTDLLVVILDKEVRLHDLGRSPLAKTVDQLRRKFRTKRQRSAYFAPRPPQSAAAHLAVYSTSLDPAFNVWENLKTYVARAVRTARDHGLRRVSIVLNTDDAVPFIGKAAEGALLGSYCFDSYKKENKERREFFDKMRVDLVALKSHDEQNRSYLDRYTKVSEAVNFARDLINEPGGVVTPERLAQEARQIASESNLDVRIWDEAKLKKEGYNGLVQVGQGSVHKPRLIRLSYKANESSRRLALVGKGVTFDSGGISLKRNLNPVFLKEHVFGPRKPDSFGSKLHCVLRILRRVGIRPNLQRTKLVRPSHQFMEVVVEHRVDSRQYAFEHSPRCPIDCEFVPRLERFVADLVFRRPVGRTVGRREVHDWSSRAMIAHDRHTQASRRHSPG